MKAAFAAFFMACDLSNSSLSELEILSWGPEFRPEVMIATQSYKTKQIGWYKQTGQMTNFQDS